MIPYEELCEALARWRTRNGMANGVSASPPAQRQTATRPAQPPQRTSAPQVVQPAPKRPSGPRAAQVSPPGGFVAPYVPPAPQAFIPATTAPEPPPLFGDPSPEDMTDLHTSAVPPGPGESSFDQPHPVREDATGEIDLDSDVIVDEEEIR